MLKNLKHLDVISNVFFLIPLFLAIWAELWIVAGIIILLFPSSAYYHLNDEKYFVLVDISLAITIFITNIMLVYLGNFNYPYFQITALFFFLSAYYWFRGAFSWYKRRFKSYDFDHSIWHILSSLITIFSILTFTSTL